MVIDFENFKDFLRIDKNSNISVIYPSKNILLKEYCLDIDNSDFVIRFNDFITKGYEKNVGSKTDMIMSNYESIRDYDKECLKLAATPKVKTKFKNYYPINYKSIRIFIKKEYGFELDKKLPTAGFLIILLLVNNGFKNINLYGYESKLTSDIYSYYYKETKRSETKNLHDMTKESAIIEELHDKKLINIK